VTGVAEVVVPWNDLLRGYLQQHKELGGLHMVGVANGTDVLELSLRALGPAPGQVVLTASNAGNYIRDHGQLQRNVANGRAP
jgi:hypothetical protein